MSATETESSDNDSCCDPEDIIVEEEMLEDTNIDANVEGERNTLADGATEDRHGQWMVKLLAFMLLALASCFQGIGLCSLGTPEVHETIHLAHGTWSAS